MNTFKAIERQMKDLYGHNTGSTAKVLSMPKVISDSNK